MSIVKEWWLIMKKKILFYIYQLVGGGAEKVMVEIVNLLDKTQYDITVITVIDCSSDIYLLNDNVNYDYIFKGKYKEDRLFFKLFKNASPEFLHKHLIKAYYDIEVAALEGIPAKIISGCKNKNTKKIAYIHADAQNIAWPSHRYKNKEQELASYNSFDNVIFVSENTKKKFAERFFLKENKMNVIYNPFDIDLIRKKSLIPVNDYKKKSKYLFCAIGRLESVKSFDRLIEAFYIVWKKNKNIELIIVGEGRERNKINLLIQKYGLSGVVKLLGYRSNPYKYLRISDCYICSSISEGLSSTVIESMIINTPIITTNCGGMEELLDSYGNGIIVNNDINGIIDGIEKFLFNVKKSVSVKNYKEEEVNLFKFSYKNYYKKLKKLMS